MAGTLSFRSIDVPGATSTSVSSVNDAGQIAGSFSDANGVGHGFIETGTRFTTLDVPGASSTAVSGINNAGQAVGTFFVGTVELGFLYSNGSFTTLDPAGATTTIPTAINGSGQVVGFFDVGTLQYGFLDTAGVIGTIEVGSSATTVSDINDAGQLVGTSGNDGFIDSAGSITLIDGPSSLHHGEVAASPTRASVINAAGQVAGTYLLQSISDTIGYLDTAGTLSSFGDSLLAVTGINASGQVVGYESSTSGYPQGIVATAGSVVLVTFPGSYFTMPEAIDTAGDIVGSYDSVLGSTLVQHGFIATACYGAGTAILTATGERPVERLAVGDQVVALHARALRRIAWIGHRRLRPAAHANVADLHPIRIRRGAIADGVPHRDLLVSPDHAIHLGGCLIPARCLLNGDSIARQPVEEVTYFHIELDRHDLLLAEGLAAESYLDTGNRAAFANGGPAVAQHPDFARRIWTTQACLPQFRDGPLPRLWQRRLAARAALARAVPRDEAARSA